MIASAVSSKVAAYIQDVLAGRQVACELVRLAVERHVRDLSRQRTDDFPYYFSENVAEAACDFFPNLPHTIGDYAGLPFELEPWQLFGIWTLFGWKRCGDDSRRFRRFYWSMARKNGKSSLAAGIAIFMAMLDVNPKTGRPEDVAEVILSATKKEQVEKVIYAEIERMRTRSPFLKSASTSINRQISFKRNKGSIRCVGSERPYDGLNPLSVLMDELHEWRDFHRKFYDTMLTGSGSRTQPLVGAVTTAGNDLSHIWIEEYERADAVLRGTVIDETLFAYVFELDASDDPLDESTWIKANPNLGVSVKLDYLKEQPKDTPFSKNRFTRYHCNRKVTALEKAFDVTVWDKLKAHLSDWSTADAIGYGVDLGSHDDLSSWAAVARFPIPNAIPDSPEDKTVWRYEVKTCSYMDEETNRNLEKPPFSAWVYQEIVKKCKYPNNQLEIDLIEHMNRNHGDEVAFDANNAKTSIERMASQGFKPFTMRQTQAWFNEPIRDFLQAIRSGRISHDGDPVLRWCMHNAVLSTSAQGDVMFDKSSSTEKIDAVVAAVMAFRVVSRIQSRATGSLFIV